ncbi:exopolyphosphatase-related protein [Candidatus Phytoplasma pruni]|uniref:Large ribosomal subunit protein bL9 n=2 Tax=Candidatus Phytoplasma pruni TaxID=479893 RepID=A0A0M1N022_9MOLU|nr:exopolyphosphatase-related protein [Candidatus Phytoplasma pruni]
MLIELIYFLNQKIDITPFEASIMYGGMAIDTNYFTYRTNSRTLDAASQLISMGAESDKVKFWFRQEFSKMLKMNQLISNMEIYMDRFAIVKSNEIIENRSFLAKVAENVLNIQNIEAAFVVGRLQEKEIGISARSYNNVNVQIIMEQMGGGGHMNSAATQIEESNIDIIVGTLKNILALEYKERAKNMKVILLEDIKNKGNKNDIIEITLGYGNFLIKEKKALLANDKNIKKIEKDKQLKEQQDLEHTALMNKLKKDIDNKQINLKITVGPKGKIYRKITMKQIVDEFFKEFNILINKKKIVLDSEINSLGVYKASVVLKKDITASFIINVTENKNE